MRGVTNVLFFGLFSVAIMMTILIVTLLASHKGNDSTESTLLATFFNIDLGLGSVGTQSLLR